MSDLNDNTLKTTLKKKDKWKGSSLPKFLTLTGLENLNDIETLLELSEKYSIEWGVCPKNSKGKGVAQWDVAAELIDEFIRGDSKFAIILTGKEASEFILNPTSIGLPYPRPTMLNCRIFLNTECVFNYRALASRIERNISMTCRMVIPQRTIPTSGNSSFDILYDMPLDKNPSDFSDKDSIIGYSATEINNVVATIRNIKSSNYWLQFEIPYLNERIDFKKLETLLNRVYD